MKYFEVQHGSDQWFKCRMGIPTSSCFDKIVTPTGVLSKQSDKYMHLLLSEIITGEPQSAFEPTFWMERGAILEAEAAEAYEFLTGYTLAPGGFITDDQVKYGASPDRLVLDGQGEIIGALEIKCPAPWTHVGNLLAGTIDKKYIPQVQGQMLVCPKFQFVDWFSYHPDIIPSRITTPRDDTYIGVLEQGIEAFNDQMDEALRQLVLMEAISDRPNNLERINKMLGN